MDPVRYLRFSIAALVAVIVLGTLGYALIESWLLFDALYMTVITLSTVGFKEVYTLSPEGKLFTIVLIICGTGMIAYTLSSLLRFTLEGQLRKILGRKKLESRIGKLRDHYIICGFGRIGHLICREFQSRPLPFVVVEKDPHLITLGEQPAINQLEKLAAGYQP
jgi:voltage-gated potassium channel